MPCWWNRDWFRGQENKLQLVASVQRECASPTLGELPQWLKGSVRSVPRREKASNSVSPLNLKSLQWLHASHTKSHLTCCVSLHIRSHRPCWRNITLWYSRTVATSIRSNLSQSGCWKSNSICLCRKWPLVCWSLQLWAPILCSFLKAGSTSRQSDGGSIRVKE